MDKLAVACLAVSSLALAHAAPDHVSSNLVGATAGKGERRVLLQEEFVPEEQPQPVIPEEQPQPVIPEEQPQPVIPEEQPQQLDVADIPTDDKNTDETQEDLPNFDELTPEQQQELFAEFMAMNYYGDSSSYYEDSPGFGMPGYDVAEVGEEGVDDAGGAAGEQGLQVMDMKLGDFEQGFYVEGATVTIKVESKNAVDGATLVEPMELTYVVSEDGATAAGVWPALDAALGGRYPVAPGSVRVVSVPLNFAGMKDPEQEDADDTEDLPSPFPVPEGEVGAVEFKVEVLSIEMPEMPEMPEAAGFQEENDNSEASDEPEEPQQDESDEVEANSNEEGQDDNIQAEDDLPIDDNKRIL